MELKHIHKARINFGWSGACFDIAVISTQLISTQLGRVEITTFISGHLERVNGSPEEAIALGKALVSAGEEALTNERRYNDAWKTGEEAYQTTLRAGGSGIEADQARTQAFDAAYGGSHP